MRDGHRLLEVGYAQAEATLGIEECGPAFEMMTSFPRPLFPRGQ